VTVLTTNVSTSIAMSLGSSPRNNGKSKKADRKVMMAARAREALQGWQAAMRGADNA